LNRFFLPFTLAFFFFALFLSPTLILVTFSSFLAGTFFFSTLARFVGDDGGVGEPGRSTVDFAGDFGARFFGDLVKNL
jgi:hypothetical protein